MFNWLKWLLLVVVLIVLFVIIYKYKHPRIDTLNIISGGLGSGKTSSSVSRTINLLRKKYFLWRVKKIKNDYIVLSNFPIGKLDKKTNKRYLKIWHKKIFCYDLDLDILTLQKRLPQNEVILLIDEFSSIANQFSYNNVVIQDNIDEFISKFRHYTNDLGYIFACDQCSQNIFLQVRRRCNYVYNMLSCHKLKLLPVIIYKYRKIYISDEVNNQVEVSQNTDENDFKSYLAIGNVFKYYNSCYLYRRYFAIDDVSSLNNSYSDNLYRYDLMKLKRKKPLYYNCLKYDGITKEDYEKN